MSLVITVISGYVLTVISGDVRPQEVTKTRGIKIEINHVSSQLFIRSVTVSIPSNVPLASFRGIENREITDDVIARLEAFVPSASGDDRR